MTQRLRRVLAWSLGVVIVGASSILIIYKLNPQGVDNWIYNQKVHAIKNFYPNYFLNKEGKYCDKKFYDNVIVDSLQITLKRKDLRALHAERIEHMQKHLGTSGNDKKYYKVKTEHQSVEIDAKLKLFGLNRDHFRDSEFFSFRLKADKPLAFIGSRELNFMPPIAREYIIDYAANEVFYKSCGGFKIWYTPVVVSINNEPSNNYLVEDFFHDHLIEKNNRKGGFIFELDVKSLHINCPKSVEDSREELLTADTFKFLSKYDEKEYFDAIDTLKFLDFIAIGIVNVCYHQAKPYNLHWYFNPETRQIEPTIREMQSWPIIGLEDKWQSINSSADRHAFYNSYLDFEGREIEPMIAHYVDHVFLDRDTFCIRLDRRVERIVDEYFAFLGSDKYEKYVKGLGPLNSFDISDFEARLRQKLVVFKNSFLN